MLRRTGPAGPEPDGARAAAVDGGARLPETGRPDPNRVRILVDPAGHTFSLGAMDL